MALQDSIYQMAVQFSIPELQRTLEIMNLVILLEKYKFANKTIRS